MLFSPSFIDEPPTTNAINSPQPAKVRPATIVPTGPSHQLDLHPALSLLTSAFPDAGGAPDVAYDPSLADDLYRRRYDAEPFVRVRDDFPATKATAGSNYCDVTVRVDEGKRLIVGLAALDNLVKGASGQAVQCMNLMFDLPEEEGLCQAPLYP